MVDAEPAAGVAGPARRALGREAGAVGADLALTAPGLVPRVLELRGAESSLTKVGQPLQPSALVTIFWHW